MLHVHPVLRYMQLPAGLLRPRVFSLFTCPQCAVGAAVQPSRARAPCSRRVEHELQNAQNGSGPPYRQCDGTARGEKHLEALEQEDLT